MTTPLTIACYLSAHGAYAQLSNPDQSDRSCRDLGQCRSLWDIVWSCMVTIFACTWLAVHLHVPKQGKGRLWKFGRRAVAFGATLIVPELVICHAWDQRAIAKKIATEYKGMYGISWGGAGLIRLLRSWMDAHTRVLCEYGRLHGA